ncbi:phosphatidylinositol transfer protein csr1 [Coemansia erecta]|nr:phosphatidylinositol transfer protein csr1 [Coemansia erecta]
MTTSEPIDIHAHYKKGDKQTSGTVGHLDAGQDQVLKEVWIKLLAHFENTKDTPIKVEKSLVKNSGLAKAGISTSDTEAVEKWYTDNTDEVKEIKNQLVCDKLYLDGNRDIIVPSTFKPLFGDSADTRTFSSAFWQATMRFHSPDSYVLKFVRASGWDTDKAFARIRSSIERRITQEIDRLMWEGDTTQHNGVTQNGMCLHVGNDRLGSPVFIVTVRQNSPKLRSEANAEKLAAYALEKAAQLSRKYGEEALIVYDFAGFKLENVDLGFTKLIVTTLQELYPLTFTATLLFVNSWLFSGFWRAIRGWLDPAIAQRTVVVKDVQTLENFVDRSQIPVEMGGQNKYEYSYVYPTKEGNAKMFDTEGRQAAEAEFVAAVSAFVEQTKSWIDGSGPATHDAKLRSQAAAAFDTASANLDPFIRAQFYDERV